MGNSALAGVDPTRTGITKHRAGPPKHVTVDLPPELVEILPPEWTSPALRFDLVPTFHPAACLRNQANFPLMTNDIGKAVAERKPDLWWEPQVVVVDQEEDAWEILRRIWEENQEYGIVIDTESGRDKDTSFGRDDGAYGNVLCVGIGGLSPTWYDQVYVFTDECLARTPIKEYLRDLLNDIPALYQNCFVGATEFIHRDGLNKLQDLVDRNVEVSDLQGGWTKARVKSYGISNDIYEVSFGIHGSSRSSLRWTYQATGNHRWELSGNNQRNRNVETNRKIGQVVSTDQLLVGDWVPAQTNPIVSNKNSEAFIHGLIFADGSLETIQPKDGSFNHSIRLCDEKSRFLYLFDKYTYPPSSNGDPICRYRANINMKALPSENVDAQYIADFIDGWQLMDGTKPTGSGTITGKYARVVQTINQEAAIWLVNNAACGGWLATGHNIHEHLGGFGRKDGSPCIIHSITISKQPNRNWIVKSIKKLNVAEEIFCVEVPQTERFILSGGILTSNSKYDVGVLMNYLDQEKPFPILSDTMLLSYALNENGGIHGLKYMGQEYLHTPDWDSAIKPYITKEHGYGSIPRDMLYKYNAFDVHVTRLIYAYFDPFIKQQGLEGLSKFLLEITRMLITVEAQGILFDLDVSKELETRLLIEQQEIDDHLPEFTQTKRKKRSKNKVAYWEEYEETGALNPRSPLQVKEYFLQHGIQLAKADEDHLQYLLDMPDAQVPVELKETVRQILASKKLSKLNGTYVAGLQKKITSKGTVHTSFLVHGTNTGRLSSRGPNLQNIPRAGDVKKQFISDRASGEVMWQVDYSQSELRVMAWLGNEPLFQECFNDPTRDIFDEVCDALFPGYIAKKYTRDVRGMSSQEREQYEDKSTAAECKETRTLIKTFAYGIAYRRSAAGIAADPAFHMTVEEAETQLNAFQKKIPNILRFQEEEVIGRVKAGKDLINPFGRHKRFWLLSDLNKESVFREASAFLPQSTSSDMCVSAAIRAVDEGIRVRNLIHDAMLGTSPSWEQAQQDVKRVDELMCDSAHQITQGVVKFATDAKLGYSWFEVK